MRTLAILAALVIGFGVGLLATAVVGYATGWWNLTPVLALAGAIGGAVLVGRLLPATGRTRGG